MKKVAESFLLPCTIENFWRVFLDADYDKALYLEELQFKDYKVLSWDDKSRKLRLIPRVNLPGPVANLFGDTFAYEQHSTLDRQAGVWSWKMVHPAGSKSFLSTSGTIRIAAVGDAQCRRSDEVAIEAHVFGLGGLIESSVEKELRSSWAKEIAFFKRWLTKTA